MRVAILSDVHGNVRACEAVLQEIRARGPFERVINAGDLAFGGPRPREAMDLLMQPPWPTIIGNTDEWIAGAPGGPTAVVAWGRERLAQRHLEFLRNLPRAMRVEPPGGPPLVVVHATPASTTDYLDPEAPPDVVKQMFEQAQTRTLVYGHIHRAYVRRVADGLVVNTGSVGFPFDGVPRPSFAILTLRDGLWDADIVRVEYDHEAVAQDLLATDHPEAETFARRLRTARMSP